MAFRKKLSRRGSKKYFKKNATKTMAINTARTIMRGGYRL